MPVEVIKIKIHTIHCFDPHAIHTTLTVINKIKHTNLAKGKFRVTFDPHAIHTTLTVINKIKHTNLAKGKFQSNNL